MKKIRLISLLLVAMFVLTTFSGAFVFGDEAEDTTGQVESTEDGAEGEKVEETAEFSHESGFIYVDPEIEENIKLLQAAEKAAEGRAVTVYSIGLNHPHHFTRLKVRKIVIFQIFLKFFVL